MEERELVLRAQRGDREALNQLVGQILPEVFALARSLRPEDPDIEDLVQDVMVRLLRNLKVLRDPERLRAYLGRIVRNMAYDRIRHRKKTESIEGDVPVASDPSAELVREDQVKKVRQALAKLSSLDREIVVLRHWAGKSYQEIAKQLGVTLSVVQTRLFRARKALAKELRGVCYE